MTCSICRGTREDRRSGFPTPCPECVGTSRSDSVDPGNAGDALSEPLNGLQRQVLQAYLGPLDVALQTLLEHLPEAHGERPTLVEARASVRRLYEEVERA